MAVEWTNRHGVVVAVSFFAGVEHGRVVQVQDNEAWDAANCVRADDGGGWVSKADCVRNCEVRQHTIWDDRRVRAEWQRQAVRWHEAGEHEVANRCSEEANRH